MKNFRQLSGWVFVALFALVNVGWLVMVPAGCSIIAYQEPIADPAPAAETARAASMITAAGMDPAATSTTADILPLLVLVRQLATYGVRGIMPPGDWLAEIAVCPPTYGTTVVAYDFQLTIRRPSLQDGSTPWIDYQRATVYVAADFDSAYARARGIDAAGGVGPWSPYCSYGDSCSCGVPTCGPDSDWGQ